VQTQTHSPTSAFNPFSLMMEPDRVLHIMERSSQLRGLKRHKLHPLDKPLIPLTTAAREARINIAAAAEARRRGFESIE
jgi:hypothetical protein